MADLRTVLAEATEASIISPEAGDRLLPFLVERGVSVRSSSEADEDEGDIVYERTIHIGSDIETPRFIRGFHDVLITIGVIVALSGLWGLTSIFVVLPAIIVLSEILVKRQRLALPAVVLTLALLGWTGAFVSLWLAEKVDFMTGQGAAIRFVAIFPAVLAVYYLRYRVPLALALCIITLLALVLTILSRAVEWLTGDPLYFVSHTGILSVIFIVCALGLFITGLWFDLADRQRRSTRSDVAFWLHLAAAPAMLYSTLFLFSLQASVFDLTQAFSAKTFLVVGIVAVMMLIGLIIDRRAFVTSGLLSLGYAVYSVFKLGTATVDTYVFGSLLAVGVIVLVIGTGWIPLRRLAVGALPGGIAGRLPPA